MLKLDLIAIGKDKDGWVTEAVEHYKKLLSKYATVSLTTPSLPTKSAALAPVEIKKHEAELFGRHLGKGLSVALSDSGRGFDSQAFAHWLERSQQQSQGRIVFMIGGPYGLDEGLLQRADAVVSLSPLTFPHQLVRIILLEQIYRAFSILNGSDYHK